MCQKENMTGKKDMQDNYAFHFLNDVEHPVVRLNAVGKERRSIDAYYWDNSKRPECYLFQYTLNGSGTVKMEGEERVVCKGMGFFLKMPGPESYYFDEKKNEAPWEFIYMLFECGAAEEYCRYIQGRFGKIIDLPCCSRAVELMFEIHAQAKRQNQSPFLLGSMVFSFLCALCSIDKERKEKSTSLIVNAKACMEELFTQPVGICDVAAICHVSQGHLSREFTKMTGVRPNEYLTKLRLKKAVDMLGSTSKALAEISAACGFSCTNYFQKVFKKYMGMSPVQFRKYVKSEGYSKFQI
ncbi:AraC family transcriptional regulator [Parablautia muri]|uniref:AraC family transcriptional regulator n=1 Tax=Parablautia muri TaxID=2320879 RepID=A0A9X5GU33_9FIRM|nr:AraC family transcriptional regulator [Parablautia muri]NBJ93627.1 AraC family transcriptional regulator [Parablautia muri]